MKYRIFKYFLLLLSISTSLTVSADVEVNATNFPDANFRNWVLNNIDGANDDVLTDAEIAKVSFIYCHEKSISSLKGIEFFTALTTLFCSNQLTSLDVSKNTALTYLDCSYNQLTSLDVSKNTSLATLYCHRNQLMALDLSKNTAIDSETTISPQSLSRTVVEISSGIAIPVPSEFIFSKVSNLKLDGTSVSGSVTTVNGQKYLVFAKAGTAYSSIDGKQLTYNYNTGNSFSSASSMGVTVTLSYAPKTYSFSIQSGSGGSVSYNGTTISNTTKSFSVEAGSSATISITPNSGYRLSRLVVNSTDRTSNVSNNKYTISNITANTTVAVTFEQIPVTTYTLSIQSGSGGSVSYNGTTISNTTRSFSVESGSSATITITPNSGYRLSRLVVNSTDRTSNVSNNKYTISNITANTTVVVTFEQIPVTTYTLSIQSGSGGSVSYNGTTISNATKSFSVEPGSSATITITPNSGYRLSRLVVNSTDRTSSVSNNQYTISNITANTAVAVTFEAIPPTTYKLTISSSGNGSAKYSGETIRGGSKSFTLNEGANATISFTPDNGYRIASVKVNNTDVTSNISNNQFTVSNITANTSVVATFEIVPQPFTQDGIDYEIESEKNHTLNVGSGEYSGHVVIPATVTQGDETWSVTGVADGAFDTPTITAITWNPPYAIGSGAFGNLTNPNLLLYVKDAVYAPANVQNVIANGRASKIVLTDAASGNDFDCPKAFTAEEISYTHHYSMTTGIGECRGWETIALPFDVKQFTHETKGALIPFKAYYSGNPYKPFWLYELTSSGFVEAAGIEANKPYIISMPNNNYYVEDYHMAGLITFSAENVTVMKSADVRKTTCGDKTFIPSFASKAATIDIYALNVNNDYCTNTDYRAEGSTFLREFRTVHPFEAYMTTNLNDAKSAIPIFENLPTTIPKVPLNDDNDEKRTRIFNMSGQQMKLSGKSSLKKDLEGLPAGVFIVNGKKLIIW